jgi:hypothetical protein
VIERATLQALRCGIVFLFRAVIVSFIEQDSRFVEPPDPTQV